MAKGYLPAEDEQDSSNCLVQFHVLTNVPTLRPITLCPGLIMAKFGQYISLAKVNAKFRRDCSNTAIHSHLKLECWSP